MPYPILDRNAARAWLAGSAEEPAVRSNDRGPRFPWEEVARRLALELEAPLAEVERELAGRTGPGRVRHASWQRFEAEAAILVHKALPGTHEALAEEAFWLWLACVPLRAIVERRYRREEGGRIDPANFGLGNFAENFVYRLWLRADCALDEAAPTEEERYALARRGQSDFWRSHVFRQRYGAARAFVRAFVRSVYPDAAKPSEPALPIEVVRELAKRLRRIFSNLLVDVLDEKDAAALIREEARKAQAQLAARGPKRASSEEARPAGAARRPPSPSPPP
ncbi:MAG: DUF6339 family protein [Geminicoccaceae bacterium]|nr:DUF6339 family protein [Geminicoccaceae bacterium]MCX8100587.1 DUF6339 family protein [Geminicoccaceae bacterium]MDW8369294.1 DUF6339 family protein [Geminicoccaceae bacterium]